MADHARDHAPREVSVLAHCRTPIVCDGPCYPLAWLVLVWETFGLTPIAPHPSAVVVAPPKDFMLRPFGHVPIFCFDCGSSDER